MWDAIVIGSGFGGAVTACRFAEAGMKVLVLERGRRWAPDGPDKYPRAVDDAWWWNHEDPGRKDGHGWMDLRVFPRIAVAQGAAVGGGSLIYANISTEAPPSAFEVGWPAGITLAELKPYYARVARFMNVGPVPVRQWPPRTKLMKEGAEKIGAGARFRPLDLAVTFDPDLDPGTIDPADPDRSSKRVVNAQGVSQGTCVHCGYCDIGCAVQAKNTLDLNYIPWAEKHGAEVRPLHLVDVIEPLSGRAGYRVRYRRLDGGVGGSEEAAKVVVACGSLGSTELLLRQRDQHGTLRKVSAQLGRGWCSNGDFLTPSFHPGRAIDPTVGPTITSAIDFLDGSRGGHRFWIQDGGVPDLIDAWMKRFVDRRQSHVAAIALQTWLRQVLARDRPLPTMMPWFAQGMDRTDGVMALKRKWWLFGPKELRLDWDVERSAALIDTIVDTHKQLAHATGGEPLVPPTWTVARYLVTPHPLGGCNMADDAGRGVVDHRGEVFGHPGLFVIDGAMVPRAVGVNPSRTIAALAERAAQQITGRTPG